VRTYTANPARRYPGIVAALVLVTALACGGCGRSSSAGARAGVHGEVRLDGKPVEAAVIAFHCSEGAKKVIALGIVENGKYQLDKDKGPLVGRSQVRFEPKPVAEAEFDAAIEKAARTGRSLKLIVMPIPSQYGEHSKLTVDVTEDGENKFDFDLKSRP